MDTTLTGILVLSLVAGLSTGLGGVLALYIPRYKKKHLAFSLGFSAGIMLYISFTELLARSTDQIGFIYANIFFFSGMAVFMAVDNFIPHQFITEKLFNASDKNSLARCGLATACGNAIHNFPEGFAIAVSSFESISLAIPLTFAIAVHNIPEGIAVSLPILSATGSRRKAVLSSLAAGLTEPAGALIGYLFLLSFLTPFVTAGLLAFVGGVMVVTCFHELLPLCFEHHRGRFTVLGIILGMMLMAGSLGFT